MSEDIVRKYVVTTDGLWRSHKKLESKRDQQFENQALWNRDYLLYVDLCNAINVGDVGRHGKHKYASQLARFLRNLHEVYPPDLSRLMQMNMLCNPTGRPNTFRPIDWLVERNNLYTKSPVIEVFRSCHVIVESAFQLSRQTLKHMPPNMSAMIERLRLHMQSTGCCAFRKGRVVEREIMDYILKGIQAVHAKKTVLPDEEALENESPSEGIEAADLEAH
ncbi:hypothetical protein EI94DRAFT_1772695 [Lactarius quietus]|nr:hypothetical protein EI94DRAFT_1772695 [Lactarius quietus]